MKDFLSITDLSQEKLWQVLNLAVKLKKQKTKPKLIGKQMVMIFEKPSLRTKLSFDLGFDTLGGHSVYFAPQEIGLGTRESVSDVSRVVSQVADLIVARVIKHQTITELAQNSKVPVINALSDLEHPCQALADFLTILETKGKLSGLSLAFVGDGENNVAHSLALGSALLGVNFVCASPRGYGMNPGILRKAQALAEKSKAVITQTSDPKMAVKNADVIYTDTWVSMGDKDETKRLKVFKPYQVDKKLMNLGKDAIFMHCLPAHRGQEVTKGVIDGSQSIVFRQAQNRLHLQKALILTLLSGKI